MTTVQDQVDKWVNEIKMKQFKAKKIDEQTNKETLVGVKRNE